MSTLIGIRYALPPRSAISDKKRSANVWFQFNVGASVESNDWNYVHSAYPGDWSAWKWRAVWD